MNSLDAANHFLELLGKASLQATVLIVLVLALQWALGRRLEPRWRHAVWLLVMLRLALPGSVPSSVSVFNWVKIPRVVELGGNQNSSVLPNESVEEKAQPEKIEQTPRSVSGAAWNYISFLAIVWGAGAIVFALVLGLNHYRFHRRVVGNRSFVDERALNLLEDCKERMGVRAPIALIETTAVDGPSLFGFLRPRLLLPPGFTKQFSEDELRFVFLHELGHVKRHDIPLGWLMALLQILHWFNPLVWVAFSRMRMDREIACDAVALSHASEVDAKPYGRTIIKLLENFGDSFCAPGLAGIVEDKKQMKERMVMIARFQKPRRRFGAMPLLFAALALVTLTDAQLGNKSPMIANAAEPQSGSPQTAQPPKIVSTTPEIGATDVDPDLKEISVTFDQDMGGGMSWTGGGPEFPPVRKDAKAKWRGKRTCVLPVKLEAGHYYRIGINSQSFQNFRSKSGMPTMPSAIYFTTTGASEKLKAKTAVPTVVTFDPPNGAKDVNAGMSELRVTFNVPMGGGFSWCTAGDDDHDFPKGPEDKHAYWTDDKKTCVLPVTLKPGMTYRVSLNAAEFKNFQSKAGVPLMPVMYTFKTAEAK